MLEPEPRHFGLIDAVLAAVALPRPTQPLLNDGHCLIHGPLMDAKQHSTAGLVLLGEGGRQTLAGAERQVPVADPVLPAVLALDPPTVTPGAVHQVGDNRVREHLAPVDPEPLG